MLGELLFISLNGKFLEGVFGEKNMRHLVRVRIHGI